MNFLLEPTDYPLWMYLLFTVFVALVAFISGGSSRGQFK